MDPTGNTVALRIIIIVILLALSAYFSSAETAEERVFDGPAAAKKDAKENTG